ncbi:MAG: hypothetical protein RR058_00020 [Oscillospiraceae bacterium]
MPDSGVLSAISMARGAGQLKIGFDATVKCLGRDAVLVLTANDISQRTLAAMTKACGNLAEQLAIDFSQDEIEEVVGRRFAVCAITDDNFAFLIKSKLAKHKEAHI